MHKFAFRLLLVPVYVQHFDTSPISIIMTQMEVINEWVLRSSEPLLLYRSIFLSVSMFVAHRFSYFRNTSQRFSTSSNVLQSTPMVSGLSRTMSG